MGNCQFNAASAGIGGFVVASATAGHATPENSSVIDAKTYVYYAKGVDLAGIAAWEAGSGLYIILTHTLQRVVTANSNGDLNPVFFASPPIVDVYPSPAPGLEQPAMGGANNVQLAITASAGALTVAIKTVAGNDPSVTDPVYFYFRDSVTGNVVGVAVTAALSLVIASTKTLGALSFPRLYISAHNDAGTVRIGGFIAHDATGIWCPQEHLKYATTVPDNVAKAFHTTVAIGTPAAWCFIGECEWTSSQTPGTWTAPNIVVLWSVGRKKPGDLLQEINQPITATNLSGTTILSYIGVPTNTAGDQYMSQAITPASAANRLVVDAKGIFVHSVSSWNAMALFQDSVTNALAGDVVFQQTATGASKNDLHFEALSALAVATTFKIRAGSNAAGTHYLNNDAASAMFGTVANSYIRIQEFKG